MAEDELNATPPSTSRPGSNAQLKVPGSETAGVDLSHISLPGELNDSVAIYDTCGEIRKKISAHLKKDGVTMAAFLRDISDQHKLRTKQIAPTSLTHFRGQSGPINGNNSPVFYGAYCFFEKLRIAQGKPKSKFRLEMEEVHGYEGVNTRGNRLWCGPDSRPYVDQYARMSVQRIY